MSGLIDKFGLSIFKFPSFSNSKTLTISDISVLCDDAAGGNDSNSFPTLIKDSSGVFHLFYSFRAGHSSVGLPDSGLYTKKSSDGGVTWTARKYIYDSNTPLYENFGIAGFGITTTGRYILYCYDTTAGGRTPYVILSDDEGTTLQARIKVSNDYDADGQQCDFTGRGFNYNGKVYKTAYAVTSGTTRNIILWESSDNGESFTKIADVSLVGGGQDYEEAHITRTPSGYWVATMRSDPNSRVDVSIGFSLTNWYNKGHGLITGFPSIGKPSIDISPSGTIAITGRQASDNKAIWGYSNDGGKTFTFSEITGVDNDFQTYGDVQWDDINGRFVMVWSNDQNFPDGPMIIYQAFLNEV